MWERGADFYLSETESGLLCERGVSDLGPVYLPASSTCGVRLAGRFTNSDAEANSYTDSDHYGDTQADAYAEAEGNTEVSSHSAASSVDSRRDPSANWNQ